MKLKYNGDSYSNGKLKVKPVDDIQLVLGTTNSSLMPSCVCCYFSKRIHFIGPVRFSCHSADQS